MLTLRPPRAADLDRMLLGARAAEPTYPEVGASAENEWPDGYRHDRYAIDLGAGDDVFQRGAEGLRRWEPFLRAGLRVHPDDVQLEPGETVLLELRVGPLTAVVPDRVVWTVAEPTAFGFAYGTLPGHDECGEEAFWIRRHADDRVTFDVAAFSRPVGLAAMGAPLTRLIQRRTNARYLTGLKNFVDEGAER